MYQAKEKNLEKAFGLRVKKLGGLSIKMAAIYFTGLPDRMAIFPGGRVRFVEFKTEGKKPTAIQLIVHRKFEALGFPVSVINTNDKLTNFFNQL